jgi:hypothetical protein
VIARAALSSEGGPFSVDPRNTGNAHIDRNSMIIRKVREMKLNLSDAAVQQRARELWEAKGRPMVRQLELWLKTEQEPFAQSKR